MFQAQRTRTTRVGSPGSDCRLLSHCVFTCTFKMHLPCYASAVVEILGWRTVRHTGEMKWGWGGIACGSSLAKTSFPVAPLATLAPSVICVNICKPKVPLSPNVRAVCLAFPLKETWSDSPEQNLLDWLL